MWSTIAPRSPSRAPTIGNASIGSGTRRNSSVSKTSSVSAFMRGSATSSNARSRRASVVRAGLSVAVVTGGADRSTGGPLFYARAGVDEPLLLHSLSEHGELIFGALDAARPRRIVEIGSETGGFSKQLLDWAGDHGATLVTVEPQPSAEIRELAAATPHFELVAGRSPRALEEVEPAGAYVIDGDHNHWTVLRELRAAFAGGTAPLVIVHDVGWPWARRA